MSGRRRWQHAARPQPGRLTAAAPRRPRLPDGELRRRVLARLQAHPELDFSPGELANVVGRPGSRGAVINICRRLVNEDLAARTRLRPQRYRATEPGTANSADL